MSKKRIVGSALLVIVLLTIGSTLALAQDSCQRDTDCFHLGEDFACNTITHECELLDFGDDFFLEGDLTNEEPFLDDEFKDDYFLEDSQADSFEENLSNNDNIENSENSESTTNTNTFDSSELEEKISAVDARIDSLEENLGTLSMKVSQVSDTVDTVNSNIQLLSTDQHQLEREIEQQVNTIETEVLAGLAVLQNEVKTTKTELEGTKKVVEESRAKESFFRTLSIIGVIIAIFLALLFFLWTHKREEEKEVPQEVKDYITKQIKTGISQENIIEALQKSGWPEHDAKWAYEQTSTHNYNKFLESQGKATKKIPKHKVSDKHYQKITVISILVVVLLGAMILFMKKSVGFAVYTGEINTDELSSLVENKLEESINQNQFYSLIDYAEACIQVNEKEMSSSFRVLKTPYGHSIKEVDTHCLVNSKEYDFAVSFSSWNHFDLLASSMSCTTIKQVHAKQQGSVAARGMYVLPSYFVAEGFTVVEGRDYSDFCSALKLCVSENDLKLLGVEC